MYYITEPLWEIAVNVMPLANRRQVLAGVSLTLASVPVSVLAKEGMMFASDKAARADEWAREFADRIAAPAISLAVANGDGSLWQAAFGRADIEMNVAAMPGHTFRLGSVSKVLTTTAAARLATRGKVDLDAPISSYMPDLPEQHRATTLRQLLTHRGGIRHYLPADFASDAPGAPVHMRRYLNDADRLAPFIDDPLIGQPGEKVSYSSYGYTLASIAMQEADGRHFLQILAEEIATPFGMDSLDGDDPLAIVKDRAHGYVTASEMPMLFGPDEAAWPKMEGDFANAPWLDQSYCWAGAGMRANAADVARFGAGVLDAPDSPLKEAERTLLFTPLTQADDRNPPLGLGWRVDKDAKDRRRWHHAGSTPGGRASLVVFPDAGLSIAICSNVMTAPGNVLEPSGELLEIFTRT